MWLLFTVGPNCLVRSYYWKSLFFNVLFLFTLLFIVITILSNNRCQYYFFIQLNSKSAELSKACEKHYQLEQELAFYKLDAKFDEMWKVPSLISQEVGLNV